MELAEKILEITNSTESQERKKESLKQCRIFEGKIRQYVVEMLEDFFSRESLSSSNSKTSMFIFINL
jgi:hypothetical protein